MAIQKITSGIIQDGAVVAADIADGTLTAAKIISIANTQITGLIQSSQIGSANATLITSGTLPSARLPANTVLQVVQSAYSGVNASMAITSSGTMVSSGFTVTITPTTATSKILVFCFSTFFSTSSNSGVAGSVALYKSVGGGAYGSAGGLTYNNYWNTIATYLAYQQIAFTLTHLDSPGTTSQIVYQPYYNISCGTSGGYGGLGGRNADGGSQTGCNMIAMEIA